MFLFLLVVLVGCTQSDLKETAEKTEVFSTPGTPLQVETVSPSQVDFNPTEDIENTITTQTPTKPKPFLKIESQINLLPAGLYLVYYDLDLGSLVALSFQLTQTPIASSNQIFFHSNNSIYALVDQSLTNLKLKSYMDIPVLEHPNCAVSSISSTGTTIVSNCEDGAVFLLRNNEWQRLFSANYPITHPILSPDDEQLAFCLTDSTEVYKSGLYRIQLDECMEDENCPFTFITSECEGALYAWSPDGTMLVVKDAGGKIHQFEFVLGSKTELAATDLDAEFEKLVWSPDGRWITFSTTQTSEEKISSAIYLMNLQVKEPRLFFESDHEIELVGWLNVITPFKTGNNYVVLPSENRYWLKDSPDEEAFNLKLLVAGEKMRVLEKSEVVNNEKWWQVRVGDYAGWVKENSLHFQNDWMYGLQSPVFETGRHLIVKLSGNDLRLREMPSLSGAVKRYLQPGMKLKIIDGPAVVDRFNWWLVEIEGSKIYGWVVEEALWYASD